MKQYKVYFKGLLPILILGRDDIDAALQASKKFHLDLHDYLRAVEIKDVNYDCWGEKAV